MLRYLKKNARECVQQYQSLRKIFQNRFHPYRFTIKDAMGQPIVFSKTINGDTFDRWVINRHRDRLLGFAGLDKVIKVDIVGPSRKTNSVQAEYKIMADLSSQGCLTLSPFVNCGETDLTGFPAPDVSFNTPTFYLVQNYLPTQSSALLGDVILAMLEQKKYGVFQGDIKPNNIRKHDNFVQLIDYDQAVMLPDAIKQSDNATFFKWVNDHVQSKYGKPHVFSDFKKGSFERIWQDHFVSDAFDLGMTSLYTHSQSTLSKNRIYHTIHEKEVFAAGVRDLSGRKPLLDKIMFQKNETVLDVGCNVGLLSYYLHDRHAKVSGIDIDKPTINAAKIVSNITGRTISFNTLDLDQVDALDNFDTICLFSVIHHTAKIEENAQKIASACRRIIIECRLVENGAKPVAGQGWQRTSSWSFQSTDDLHVNLQKLFPNFILKTNYGQGDKGRYIIELIKESAK